MTEKQFTYIKFDIVGDFEENELKLYEIDNNPSNDLDESNLFYVYSNSEMNIERIVDKLNTLTDEIEELKQALKNSYINEICENCKYGHYWISETFGYGLEGEFECTKKHFGNNHWKCDGLTECDDFELEIKG